MLSPMTEQTANCTYSKQAIGLRLKTIRLGHGLCQNDFAKRAGLSIRTVLNHENGVHRTSIDSAFAFKMLKIMIWCLTISLISFVFVISTAAAAEIGFIEKPFKEKSLSKFKQCDFYLIGKINRGDDEQFKNIALSSLQKKCIPWNLFLFSPGGNLNAAINIGRHVSALALHTIAPNVSKAVTTPPTESARGWSR
ncbi:MAG: helix-turn-helix transcriptional regulator [bacterium]|nr:helix-turn-helix transcriptional regulator [bacterium]